VGPRGTRRFRGGKVVPLEVYRTVISEPGTVHERVEYRPVPRLGTGWLRAGIHWRGKGRNVSVGAVNGNGGQHSLGNTRNPSALGQTNFILQSFVCFRRRSSHRAVGESSSKQKTSYLTTIYKPNIQ